MNYRVRRWPTSAWGLGYRDWYGIINIGGFEAIYRNADFEVFVGSLDDFERSVVQVLEGRIF